MTLMENFKDRPKRVHPYIPPNERDKNKTMLSDKHWKIKVNKSKEWDEFMEQKGKAIAELSKKPEPIVIESIHLHSLYKLIIRRYEEVNDCEWNKGNNEFLKLLVYYSFSPECLGMFESKFRYSPLLVHKIGNKQLNISNKKRLFIVGTYGYGKSSLFEIFDDVIKNSYNNLVTDVSGKKVPLIAYRNNYKAFRIYSAIELVDMAKNNPEKYLQISTNRILTIDDLFREPKFYGEQLIGKLIEERYKSGLVTHVICNYQGEEKTIESTMIHYAEQYGASLLDRAWQMYNFIEVKSQSKRV